MLALRATAPTALLVALLATTPLVACRTTEVLETPAALAGAEPLPITLSESLRLWRTERAPVSKRRYRVGAALAELFPARDGHAFLSPFHDRLESAFDPREQAFVARYELSLALQHKGQKHEFVANGTGRSLADAASAERAAVEDCLNALYASARELLLRRDA